MTDPWRKLPEWVGKHPDSAIPGIVQERICRRYDDICQGICHQKLGGRLNVHMDHIIPLRDWTGDPPHGHREGNLQPICHLCHRIKTGLENTAREKTRDIRRRHLGIEKAGEPMPGTKRSRLKKCLDGSVVDRETGEVIWGKR